MLVTQTGATPVHAGAEAKTQVLYLCKFHRNLPSNMEGFSFPIDGRKKPKKHVPTPLKFLKDLKFWGTSVEDLLQETKYFF